MEWYKLGKAIMFMVYRLLIVFVVILNCTFFSCEGLRIKKLTPENYINHVVVTEEKYTKDKMEILRLLTISLSKHEDFFDNSAYFDSTKLIIDSIIYSPDFNKIAVFVITMNPTYRQLSPNPEYSYYYDATCYLGTRKNDSLALSWIGPNFSNSYNKDELSSMIRNSYFTEFASEDTGLNKYKYNLNDVRFWGCPIWIKIEEMDADKKLLEKDKKEHPENYFNPNTPK